MANPTKPKAISDILLRNREKLIDFLSSFHTDRKCRSLSLSLRSNSIVYFFQVQMTNSSMMKKRIWSNKSANWKKPKHRRVARRDGWMCPMYKNLLFVLANPSHMCASKDRSLLLAFVRHEKKNQENTQRSLWECICRHCLLSFVSFTDDLYKRPRTMSRLDFSFVCTGTTRHGTHRSISQTDR